MNYFLPFFVFLKSHAITKAVSLFMSTNQFRQARPSDISALAQMRASDWGTEEFWAMRISGYMKGEHNPQKALPPRIVYVAIKDDKVVGFIAGHLTRRFECDGELQWINIIPEFQRYGIASELLRLLATWFIENKSLQVCVNVDPDNSTAQQFYKRHNAESLNEHWLFWKDINMIMKEQ
jgi:ribosomal protein S18 acetylase RimI-like enzyme